MKKEFVVIIKQHRILGCVLLPFFINRDSEHEFATIAEAVVTEDIVNNPENYSKPQKDIAKLASEYSDVALLKFFAKRKKITPLEFLNSLKEDYVENYVRPYIEKRILKIIDICKENNIKLFFRDKSDSIFYKDEIIIGSQSANVVFNFARKETETLYYVTIKHKDKQIKLLKKAIYTLCNKPCVIVFNNRMLFFDNVDAKKIIPFTTKEYVSVPKKVELEYYKKFVKSVIKSNYCVNNLGFDIRVLDVRPQAVLAMQTDWQDKVVFVLSFRYNKLTFKPDSENYVIVDFFDDNGQFYFTKLCRNLDYERETEQAACDIFGSRLKLGVYKVDNDDLSEVGRQTSASIDFININRERFVEAGIVLEQETGEKMYYTGSVNISLSVDRKTDWFDIYAVVKLDDFEFPFIHLRNYILNNIFEYKLPDGRIFVLPQVWFDRFKDLFFFGNISSNSCISLKDYQYQTLLQLPLTDVEKGNLADLESDLSNIGKLPSIVPQKVNATLRPYQITAFNWLSMMRNHNFGAVLADDMGLGKTLCTLSLLSQSGVQDGEFADGLFSFAKKIPSLLVVPKSLIYNWIAEAKKFVPHIKIMEYSGTGRNSSLKSFPLFDIIITSYGTLRNDVDMLEKQQFNYVVLDESQTIKNPLSKTYSVLMKIQCRHRLALTGTPIENSLTDLWAQINFVNPGMLGSLTNFKKRFINSIEKNNSQDSSIKLKKIVYPFILRRTKQQVLDDLPELTEQTILCEMSEKQRDVYESEKSKIRNSIIDFMDRGVLEKSSVMVLQGLTKLRQIACSPSLIDSDYSDVSGKTDEILRALQNIVAQKHKVLVFSAFVRHLELIASQLATLDIDYTMLTGSTEQRSKVIEKFEDPNVPVFLISIKAGGTGLNLTQADYVFIIDPWWNPAVEQQAIARAHRIGQKSNVMVYRFLTKDTVEEKIQKFQQKKFGLAETFVSENTIFSKESGTEILNLL